MRCTDKRVIEHALDSSTSAAAGSPLAPSLSFFASSALTQLSAKRLISRRNCLTYRIGMMILSRLQHPTAHAPDCGENEQSGDGDFLHLREGYAVDLWR